jgi:hypothetical protein
MMDARLGPKQYVFESLHSSKSWTELKAAPSSVANAVVRCLLHPYGSLPKLTGSSGSSGLIAVIPESLEATLFAQCERTGK